MKNYDFQELIFPKNYISQYEKKNSPTKRVPSGKVIHIWMNQDYETILLTFEHKHGLLLIL